VGKVRATVVRRAGNDTVRFALPAVARRCVGRRALLLESADYRGNGVLVLLLHGDSSAPRPGSYPVTLLGDSTTPRGANVAVRYMIRDAAYGYALDRGTVELTAVRGSFTARVTGDGVEAATQVSLAAEYDRVPLAADSVPCRYQP
jgi:hypothetical protein